MADRNATTTDEFVPEQDGAGSIDDCRDTDDDESDVVEEVIVHNEPLTRPCYAVHLIIPLPNIPHVRYVCGICDDDYATLEEILHHVLSCINRDVQHHGTPSTRVDFYVSFWSWYPGQEQVQ